MRWYWLGLCAVALFVGCNTAPTPEAITSVAGRYKANFPNKAKPHTQTENTPLGAIAVYGHIARTSAGEFVVTYCDYPAGATNNRTPTEVLEDCFKGVRLKVKGTLASKTKIELAGHPGLSFQLTADINKQPMTLEWHIYLVKNRLYQVGTIGPKGGVPAADAAKFFDSFALLKE